MPGAVERCRLLQGPEAHHDGHDTGCESEVVFQLEVAQSTQPAVTDVLGRNAPEVASPTRTAVSSSKCTG